MYNIIYSLLQCWIEINNLMFQQSNGKNIYVHYNNTFIGRWFVENFDSCQKSTFHIRAKFPTIASCTALYFAISKYHFKSYSSADWLSILISCIKASLLIHLPVIEILPCLVCSVCSVSFHVLHICGVYTNTY